MLDEYKDFDNIVYSQLKGALKKGLSHAYLFNTNENVYAEKMIISFISGILCKEHESLDEYKKCSVCKKIEHGNHMDLKKIYPDGLWIKKEQLEELQKDFSKKPVESDKKVYIIYEVEKLNKSAANSLLKFLEEPEEGIIAILITNNINLVISTIVSRCQIINFKKNNVEEYINSLDNKENSTIDKIMFSVFKITNQNNITKENIEFANNVVKFVENYENYGKKIILTSKNYFINYIEDKVLIINFFECLILFYRDVIEYKLYNKIDYYNDYKNIIEKISNTKSLENLISKLNKIIEAEIYIKNNANINLLIDSLIISMEEQYD
jgi:DNA polymerase-3 subunit delta'